MTDRLSAFLLCLLAVLAGPSVFARGQAPQRPVDRGQLVLTVTDTTSAVLPGAVVTVVGLDEATKSATVTPVKTSERGVATFDGLVAGRYRVQIEFPSFQTASKEMQVRRGENRQAFTLELKQRAEEVTVGQDPESVDARGGYYLSPEEIERLPDNPRALANVLKSIAGTNVIFVDGFQGGALPPKSQIKSIHISEDAFAAEYHSPGGRVDVITQVGEGPFSGGANYGGEGLEALGGANFRFQGRNSASLLPSARFAAKANARSPFADAPAGMGDQAGGGNVGGAIVPKRVGLATNFFHERSYTNPLVNAMTPQGQIARVSDYHQVYDEDDGGLRLEFRLSPSHSVRTAYSYYWERDTQGVGGFQLVGHGNEYEYRTHTFRLQENGAIGTHAFVNTRLQLEWWREEYQSDVEARTLTVLDAFTAGGAQQAGGQQTRSIVLASELDYVRKNQSVRTGFSVDASRTESALSSNYLGSYVFESLAAYEAGKPRAYTQIVGDPRIEYPFMRGGFFVQDDIRLKKNLVVSPGVRYEAQRHIPDKANWGPRVGLNWTPGSPGRIALRLSWGVFYDWMATDVYEQSVRLDGVHQSELNIGDPSYPSQPASGLANTYHLGSDLGQPRLTRTAAGVSHRIGSNVRVNVNYTYTRGGDQFRGKNLNAPVNGVRPDPSRANVIHVVSDARSAGHSLDTGVQINFAGVPAAGIGRGGRAGGAGPGGAPGGRGRAAGVDWHRQNINFGYTYNRQLTDTTGPYSVPASGTLATEWAAVTTPNPNNTDLRHGASLGYTNTVFRNLYLYVNYNWSLGGAYTWYTGADVNNDLIFNDRPDGVARNSLRAVDRSTWFGQITYSISGGPRQGNRPHTVQLVATLQNVKNRYNYVGYSGVTTSPFFKAPTAVLNPRVFRFNINVNF